MSSVLTVYIGAYLIIKTKKVQTLSPFICPDHPAREFWKQDLIEHQFCQKCGQKLVSAAPRLRTPCLWDLLPDNDDEFYEVETYGANEPMIIISNIRSESKPDHMSMGHIDNIDAELTSTTIINFTENFLANHEKSIEILRGVSEEITVKFGVVQHYN